MTVMSVVGALMTDRPGAGRGKGCCLLHNDLLATSQLRLVESLTVTLSGCRRQVHFVGLIAARPCLGGGETGRNLSGSHLFFRRRLFGVIRGHCKD